MSDETRTNRGGGRRGRGDPRSDTELAIAADANAELDAEARRLREAEVDEPSGRQASLWHDAWLELRRNPLAIVSAVFILLFIVMAIAPGLFTSIDPGPAACSLSNSLGRPQQGHPFGFDIQGCDYYTQVIYGARASIAVGVLTTLSAFTIALIFGSLAGYFGGLMDAVIARITDVVFAIPTILGGIVLLSVLDNRGIVQVSAVLILLGWTTMLRLMRSSVLSIRDADFVVAARALGARNRRVLTRHILPNAVAPVIVYATIYVGIIISAEAALSFLGVGLQLPNISWGLQLNAAQNRLLQAPHLLLFPGLFLSVTIFAFILMGDALRDALDPKLR